MAVGPPLRSLGFTHDGKPHTSDNATVFSTLPIHGHTMDASELYIQSTRIFAVLIAFRSLDITKLMLIRDVDKLLWTQIRAIVSQFSKLLCDYTLTWT